MLARLAPSPTGYLHIGNARSFLLAWLQARSVGGKIILRIEDLDQARAVGGADKDIVRDLEWLGLDWDNELTPDYYQSKRFNLYQSALDRLAAQDLLYPCYCSRKELAEAMSAPHSPAGRYPGTCRNLTASERKSREVEKEPALRFRVDPGRVIEFNDLICGTIRSDVYEETGDFIVARADGVPSYQLAVVLDDIAMRVTHILRGNDLLDSTPRQLLLYQTLKASPPTYAHVPLILGSDGKRLAKRHGSVSIAEIRASGGRPEEVIGWLAWSCGLRSERRDITARELVQDFELAQLKRNETVLTSLNLFSR
ncbi:MAG: tRNA glutamyl-Q(34) synthetase GluQRS [Candidatus Kapaibacterium sp.]